MCQDFISRIYAYIIYSALANKKEKRSLDKPVSSTGGGLTLLSWHRYGYRAVNLINPSSKKDRIMHSLILLFI